jgi:hypothetical protein
MNRLINGPSDDPDRKGQYRLEGNDIVNILTGVKYSVVDQLDENFKQVRLFRTAIADRDKQLSSALSTIDTLRRTNGALLNRLALVNKFWWVANKFWSLVLTLGAAIGGGLASEGLKIIVRDLLHTSH